MSETANMTTTTSMVGWNGNANPIPQPGDCFAFKRIEDDRSHVCPDCKRNYRLASGLERHRRLKHG